MKNHGTGFCLGCGYDLGSNVVTNFLYPADTFKGTSESSEELDFGQSHGHLIATCKLRFTAARLTQHAKPKMYLRADPKGPKCLNFEFVGSLCQES